MFEGESEQVLVEHAEFEAYDKLGYGEASCPAGADLTTWEACQHAAAALDIWHKGEHYWMGTNGRIPRYCSITNNGRLHFAGANSGGIGRSDLAPICKPTNKTNTNMGTTTMATTTMATEASSQTTEDEQPDCCDSHFCLAFGDPHFVTFDGVSVRGLGPKTPLTQGRTIFWLVKSDSVKIQGVTYGKRGITTGFAATGSWLNGHNLTLEMDGSVVKAANHYGKITVTWDGVEILKEMNDEFVDPGFVTAKRGQQLITEEHFKDLGGNQLAWMNYRGIGIKFKGHYYHFTLPKNVQIFVDAYPKGWGLGLLVKMGGCGGTPLAEIDGWCGPTPFGGEDRGVGWNNIVDWKPKANFVDANEIAFPTEAALAEVDADGSMTRDSEMDINGLLTSESETCNGTMTWEKAEEVCKVVWDLSLKKECIFDVCMTGDPDAALDALGAEFLEVEDGRGIPVFVGNGHCLDHNGNQYTAFEKADITKADGCKSALKQLVGVKEVRGAQLQQGYGCQILVDSGHILSPLMNSVSEGNGTALIVSVDNETGYSCWRLN